LYLVPCTLGIVLLLAVVRGELHLLLDAQLDLEDSTVEVDATGGSHGTTGLDHDSTGSGAANEGVSAVAAGQQKRLWARPGADRTGSRSGSGPGAEQRVALLAGQQASGSWNGLAQQHQQQPQ
jgi:hypothetical protein